MPDREQPDDGAAKLLAELRELLEKYDLLLQLSAGEPGRTLGRRDALRAVAKRFPGALREWEGLPPAELLRRRAYLDTLLQRCADDAATAPERVAGAEPWLRYALALHTGLRSLLLERPNLAARPGRRLSALAYEQVAQRYGVSAAEVKQALFMTEGVPGKKDERDA